MKNQMIRKGRKTLAGVGLAVAMAMGASQPAQALTAGENYNVVVYKVNSDGTTTSVSSTSATADSNGKIGFSLASLPTATDTNFIFIEVKDSSNTVVRRAFAPAPPAGSTNAVGVNQLSDIQAQAIQASMTDNATDDPMGVAFGLVFVRSPDLTSSDISILADMMGTAILGSDGMEAFLLSHGVSSSQLATFKKKIVANTAADTNDLADYMAYFKSAVDNNDDDEMAKAGGVMAEVFMDAAVEADIDPGLILAAFDAAGSATGLDALMSSLSSGFAASIEQAVNGFFTRIGSAKLKTEYTKALNDLAASGAEVTRFNSAVQTFLAAQQAIDVQYAGFFTDPAAYAASVGKTQQQVQNEINSAFDSAWSTFRSDLQSTSSEITSMQQTVAAGLQAKGETTTATDLDNDGVGTEYDFNGNPVNWPIPQTVSVNWVGTLLANGGDFTYTPSSLAAPSNMGWLDGNGDGSSDGNKADYTDAVWGMPTPFANLMNLMQDVQVVEHYRYLLWDGGGQPTQDQQEQARVDYANRLAGLVSNIGGTTDGSTAISTVQKQALVKLMQEPELH